MARTCIRGGHRPTVPRPLPVNSTTPHNSTNRTTGSHPPALSKSAFTTALELYRLGGDALPWLEPGTVAQCPASTWTLRHGLAGAVALRSITDDASVIQRAGVYSNWHAGEVDIGRIFNADGSKKPFIIAVVIPDTISLCLEFVTQLREGNMWCANMALVHIGAAVRYYALGTQTDGVDANDQQTMQRYEWMIRLVAQFCIERFGRQVFAGVALQLFEAVRCRALLVHVMRQISPLLVDAQSCDDERNPCNSITGPSWINPKPYMLFDLQNVVNSYVFDVVPEHITHCRAVMGRSVLLVDFSRPHVMTSDSSLYASVPVNGGAPVTLGLSGDDADALLGELFS